MPESNEKKYQRNKLRRAEWIAKNGPCVRCGTWDKLEVDHIDPLTKEHEIKYIWQRSEDVRNYELAKCQVLCNACHIEKSTMEQKANKPVTHGSYKYYRRDGCRCDICVFAQRKRLAQYREKNRTKLRDYARMRYHKNKDSR